MLHRGLLRLQTAPSECHEAQLYPLFTIFTKEVSSNTLCLPSALH
jgi:hypothetical protein